MSARARALLADEELSAHPRHTCCGGLDQFRRSRRVAVASFGALKSSITALNSTKSYD
jgi:hypothetical protein